MWCGFAAMVNHSMAWLKGRWVQSFVLGALLGPVAYKAGEGLGAIQFNGENLEVTVMLALVWGLSMPLIYWVNDRLGLREKLDVKVDLINRNFLDFWSLFACQ